MDHAVAAAYDWGELDLGHGFHATAQGVRYTISDAARRQVLGRLLELNHARHRSSALQRSLLWQTPVSNRRDGGAQPRTLGSEMGDERVDAGML